MVKSKLWGLSRQGSLSHVACRFGPSSLRTSLDPGRWDSRTRNVQMRESATSTLKIKAGRG